MAKDQSLSHLAYCIFCGSKNHGVNVSINEGNVGMLALKLKKSAAVTVCMECLCKAMPELVGQVPVAFNGTIDELIRTVMPANEQSEDDKQKLAKNEVCDILKVKF